MAKFFKAFSFLTMLFLTSCQEGGEAGDLLGQWRMAGSDNEYISFSGSLTLFRNITKGEVYGSFQHVGDSLFIQCYSIDGAYNDTIIVEKDFGFSPFQNIRMKIEVLNSDALILSKGHRTWNFYKY